MALKYSAVLFDLDGTLLDSFDFHGEVIYLYLKQKGYEVTKNIVKEHIGNTMENVLLGCNIPKKDISGITDNIGDFYIKNTGNLINSIVFSKSTIETLKCLKSHGIKMGIVTNSMEELLESFIDKNNARGYFDVLSGASTNDLDKVNRYAQGMKSLKVLPQNTLYVGDTKHDILLAKKCNTHSCLLKNAIGWEKDYNSIIADFKPNYVIEEIEELIQILSREARND